MEKYDVKTMGNWHHDIVIDAKTRTRDLSPPSSEAAGYQNKDYVVDILSNIYENGLRDKNILDVACNAGGHLFSLNRVGIKHGFGFDVRKMWINQAEWVKRNIDCENSRLEFKTGSFKLLNKFEDNYFHVSLFNGIFYHLADPVSHLISVAKKTSETIMINTAYEPDSEVDKPALVFGLESSKPEHALSGVEGISWKPNGEIVLFNLMRHLGFSKCRLLFKKPQEKRLAIIATRV